MDKVTLLLDTGYFKYPNVEITFDGTKISRFYKDDYLSKSIFDIVVEAGEDKDTYDFTNYIFSAVNQIVKRHYTGQDLMLHSVKVVADGNYWVTISR